MVVYTEKLAGAGGAGADGGVTSGVQECGACVTFARPGRELPKSEGPRITEQEAPTVDR